ncbi:MAG: hypothetical protein II466_03505 [Bacteroidales bacterium]|jgi:hypothetical protein|nr:hypothetical protein [Bacteroidales bacterium]MBQ2090655.1 hypothetical protein [Bacteroidales bacterium]MDT3361135.1 hypothetical protein [Bacteroidota bacterium]
MRNLNNILKSLIPPKILDDVELENRPVFAEKIIKVFRENNADMYNSLVSAKDFDNEEAPVIVQRLREAALVASKIR